ncbi:MAG TPA: competence protein ComFB [Syntrophomonas sp.]|jgi:competence protein ComFB|nr:competence protein ComFB [Syntrophomonas sp.]
MDTMDSRIVNVVEQAVWDLMRRVLEEKHGICTCPKCQADIAALALNNLKPRYVTSAKGEALARADSLDQTTYIAVLVALAKAIEQVAPNPRHEVSPGQ